MLHVHDLSNTYIFSSSSGVSHIVDSNSQYPCSGPQALKLYPTHSGRARHSISHSSNILSVNELMIVTPAQNPSRGRYP